MKDKYQLIVEKIDKMKIQLEAGEKLFEKVCIYLDATFPNPNLDLAQKRCALQDAALEFKNAQK